MSWSTVSNAFFKSRKITPLTMPLSILKVDRSRYNTQTLDRIRLCFRMKPRFSDAFLVSHRIMQRQRMQNIYVLALETCDVAFKFSPLRLVSSFAMREPTSVSRVPICNQRLKKKINRAELLFLGCGVCMFGPCIVFICSAMLF